MATSDEMRGVQELGAVERLEAHDDSEMKHLFNAIRARDAEKTECLLVERRIYHDCKDSDGRTPLSWATELGLSEVVELLLKSTDVNVNERDNDGRTPLSWTAMWKHKPAKKATTMKANTIDYWKILELLLQSSGIDVNSKDVNG
ncbi:hypothetical protein QQZ08_002970 [Neonectria magnoliae]|uniref:Ankyrin repeat protein n=1 Tax=Neonectria magnoliae TaxID=2732573 RepID=A0ABR1IA86_9HYPO